MLVFDSYENLLNSFSKLKNKTIQSKVNKEWFNQGKVILYTCVIYMIYFEGSTTCCILYTKIFKSKKSDSIYPEVHFQKMHGMPPQVDIRTP